MFLDALIVLDGVEFPNPDEYKVEIEPIGTFERNANGVLVGDLLDNKVRINISWGMLEDMYYKRILQACDPYFVDVTYYDPRAGEYSSAKMYVASRSGKLAVCNGCEIWWSKVSVSLIER